jgi:predicted nucleotidyltransferase
MLVGPLLGYKSTWRILDLLFETPRKLISRVELLNFTKLGNSALSKGLNRLVKNGIIILEQKGKKEFYYVDEKNEYAGLLIELWKKENRSLRNLPYNIKLILSDFLRNLNDSCSEVDRVILFGSQAKGTASINSDIDIAVIFTENLTQEMEVTKIVHKLEKQFKIKIQIHYFTSRSFSAKNKLVEEINADGIVLT